MKKNNIFWVSFSDLMTSLYFVMLVLFVLAIGYLKIKEEGLIKEKERLEKLLNLEKQFQPLTDDKSFIYLKECKKYIVKDLIGIEISEPMQDQIKTAYTSATITAGQKLQNFLGSLKASNPDLSYLLVIEGNMANKQDMSIYRDAAYGYEISYKRALAVYNLWLQNNINFRNYNVEVLICGSGFNGLCRDNTNEAYNKRFSIQIIPKVSR